MKKLQPSLSGTLKREFQKDLELFKHFLLLLNNTGPIRNVELMWNEELDCTKPKYKNRVGTGDALVQLQPAGSANRSSPSTLFCDLVHGFGAHEEETCAKSDVPAQQRCRQTGCTQVYACHAGLTDIAVPVICDGQYLGTLFSGQVLTHPPTPEGFEQVRRSLTGQAHINFEELEAAYYRVPVVSAGQVAEMVRVLELFARYISNSWKRLQIMAEFQRRVDRELALDRKELGATLLSGEVGDRHALNELARRCGVQRLPDRVLVVQVKHRTALSRAQISDQLTLSRLSHVAEDVSQNWPNTLAIVVRPGELCIFTSQEARNPSHQRITLLEMAEAVLAAVQENCQAVARIGISEVHPQPPELLQGYQEACAALESGDGSVLFFNAPAQRSSRPVEILTWLLKAMQSGTGTTAPVREFLAHATPAEHTPAKLQQSRALLTWAIEHLFLEASSLVADAQPITAAKEMAVSGVLNAPTPFNACEAFRRFTEILAEKIGSAYSQREQKIVFAVYRLVEERGATRITIQELADALHLSSGHLSRIFRRTAGITLEGYLIRQRVEMAKRTLLDPRFNVAEVAERCGFCNPAYFASVFKKYVHCTPREFASRPHRMDTVQ